MPHIELHATCLGRNIEKIDISVQVDFSKEYFHTPKAAIKLKELQEDFEKLVEKYFELESISSRWLYNHDYNRNKEPDC